MGLHGVLAAHSGNRAEAQRIAEHLRAIDRPYLFGPHTLWSARIRAQLGNNNEEAIALLREAFGQGLAHGVWTHRDIDLEPLRAEPAYKELVRPKG